MQYIRKSQQQSSKRKKIYVKNVKHTGYDANIF